MRHGVACHSVLVALSFGQIELLTGFGRTVSFPSVYLGQYYLRMPGGDLRG